MSIMLALPLELIISYWKLPCPNASLNDYGKPHTQLQCPVCTLQTILSWKSQKQNQISKWKSYQLEEKNKRRRRNFMWEFLQAYGSGPQRSSKQCSCLEKWIEKSIESKQNLLYCTKSNTNPTFTMIMWKKKIRHLKWS